MKKFFFIAFIAFAIQASADVIRLTNGKTVEGTITQYSSGEGLKVITDVGETTIKLNQVESFRIVAGQAANQSVSFENSRLKKLGIIPDFSLISGMDFQFDVAVGQVGEVLLYGIDETLGIGIMITEEAMDITNEEYFKTLDALQKANFDEFTETPKRTAKVGPFQALQKTYNAKVSGMDFTYKLITFKQGTTNHRILFWALVPVFERADAKVMKFLNGITLKAKSKDKK